MVRVLSAEAPGCCDGSLLAAVEPAASCRVVGRVNRFTVEVRLDGGGVERVHINNTGRLEDALVPGRRGLCTPLRRPGRTRLRLSFLEYGPCRGGYAVIDTRLQEEAFARAVEAGLLPWLRGCRVERGRPRMGGSVFDYLLRCPWGGVVVETKSAVLVSPEGLALYPDCPTERGRRHLLELARLARRGQRGLVVFIAAFPGARGFAPNREADPLLADALRAAVEAGVEARSIGVCYSPERRGVLLYSSSLPVVLR